MKKIKDFLIKLLGGYTICLIIGEETGNRFTIFNSTVVPLTRTTFKFKNLYILMDSSGIVKVERHHNVKK